MSKLFGTMPDGAPVELYTIRNDNGMSADVITLGCRIVRLMVPDRAGALGNVVLGHDTVEEYLGDYLGTAVGRYANRIGRARFALDGKEYALSKNDGENTLHGGPGGFSQQIWKVEQAGGDSISFSYSSKDGEEGYPGNLSVFVSYQITPDNALKITYRAKTDAPTPVNLTNHSFFNLTGDHAHTILSHQLQLHADGITEVEDDLIPTGKILPVAGTPYDFTQPKEIGRDMFADDHMLQLCGGYDHNFVLQGEGFRRIGQVAEQESGRVMEVYTDLPGVQLYTANKMSGKGLGGVPHGNHCAFCLETQYFPDSPNHSEFPFHFLQPGEDWESVTVYQFKTC